MCTLRLHLTLNPSPEGEGLSSISDEMVALNYVLSKWKEWAICHLPPGKWIG
jgi:hypothetical protein